MRGNEFYHVEEARLADLREKSPWTSNPTFFKSVSISPTAIVKMLTHCHSGVEKGIHQGGRPIEVMGLMLGRPDPTQTTRLIVTDVFPLPIEGFETRVIADDQDVVNYMIALGESLEVTRKEKFMGWYHSHPFDLSDSSHCFLSQTDLSTQLQWQRAEDPHGNPFLAIVVDPLRGLHLNKPQLKAFRAYPPEYTAPVLNQCPDGTIEVDEHVRLEKWGSCWNRYYEIQVEYFMSAAAKNIMDALSPNLWMRGLQTKTTTTTTSGTSTMSNNSSAPHAACITGPSLCKETYAHVSTKVGTIRNMVHRMNVSEGVVLNSSEWSDVSPPSSSSTSSLPYGVVTSSSSSIIQTTEPQQDSAMQKLSQTLMDMTAQEIHEKLIQEAKAVIFS